MLYGGNINSYTSKNQQYITLFEKNPKKEVKVKIEYRKEGKSEHRNLYNSVQTL